VVNAETMCALLRKIAALGLAQPVYIVLDNARYQHCALVKALAQQLNIDLPGKGRASPPYPPLRTVLETLASHGSSKLLAFAAVSY
jgi:hypothetical protein